MGFCYFICDEKTPRAEKYSIGDDVKKDIWLVRRIPPESLNSDLIEETANWVIEEYYTENDGSENESRYCSSGTILHSLDVENAIADNYMLVGAVCRVKADGSLQPVLIGGSSTVRGSERSDDTHVIEKRSSLRLIRCGDK